jgi:hypothetical protein
VFFIVEAIARDSADKGFFAVKVDRLATAMVDCFSSAIIVHGFPSAIEVSCFPSAIVVHGFSSAIEVSCFPSAIVVHGFSSAAVVDGFFPAAKVHGFSAVYVQGLSASEVH